MLGAGTVASVLQDPVKGIEKDPVTLRQTYVYSGINGLRAGLEMEVPLGTHAVPE